MTEVDETLEDGVDEAVEAEQGDAPTAKLAHRVRTRDGGTREIAPYYRSRAIALFCTECMGWAANPLDCTALLCPLFPFRRKTLRSQTGDGL